jgi:hypothetical protein
MTLQCLDTSVTYLVLNIHYKSENSEFHSLLVSKKTGPDPGLTHSLLHWAPHALSPALKLVERGADYSLPRVKMSGVITLLFLAPSLRTQEEL